MVVLNSDTVSFIKKRESIFAHQAKSVGDAKKLENAVQQLTSGNAQQPSLPQNAEQPDLPARMATQRSSILNGIADMQSTQHEISKLSQSVASHEGEIETFERKIRQFKIGVGAGGGAVLVAILAWLL